MNLIYFTLEKIIKTRGMQNKNCSLNYYVRAIWGIRLIKYVATLFENKFWIKHVWNFSHRLQCQLKYWRIWYFVNHFFLFYKMIIKFTQPCSWHSVLIICIGFVIQSNIFSRWHVGFVFQKCFSCVHLFF